MMHEGLLVTAIADKMASGSGKTTITASLLAFGRAAGYHLAPYKIGPDYLDGKVHERITKSACYNLDGFAMAEETLNTLLAQAEEGSYRIIEGVMGFTDGAKNGKGSSAELCQKFGWGILLVIRGDNEPKLLLEKIQDIKTHYHLWAVVINQASEEQKKNWQDDLAGLKIPYVFLSYDEEVLLPHRHLGLTQADEWQEQEWQGKETALKKIADTLQKNLGKTWQDMWQGARVGTPSIKKNKPIEKISLAKKHRPLCLAVAYDIAFGFVYRHQILFWQKNNIEVKFFSPLLDEAPDKKADGIFLAGGYPELHLTRLSKAKNFYRTMRLMADDGVMVYGECGGFMMLGDSITAPQQNIPQQNFPQENTEKKTEQTIEGLGLLPLTSSFTAPRLHLGYRLLTPQQLPCADIFRPCFIGDRVAPIPAHEFHYCSMVAKKPMPSLFMATDSLRQSIGEVGMVKDNIAGSFIHII